MPHRLDNRRKRRAAICPGGNKWACITVHAREIEQIAIADPALEHRPYRNRCPFIVTDYEREWLAFSASHADLMKIEAMRKIIVANIL
ncbi:hypothetical protein SPYCW_1641 [Sphingopyxis sp. EG6]|nr:hypothetical protein SPYCW_1641 [Sphingopyxis sp. EG6]